MRPKTNQPLLLISTVVMLLASNTVFADSWTITQGTTATGNNTSITQTAASTNSTQAINSVNLNGTTGIVSATSSQVFNAGDNDLTLQQDLSTSSSKQAANRVYANTIEKLTQSITITPITSKTVNLKQLAGVGNGNTQAINTSETSTETAAEIKELSQTLSGDSIDIKQSQLGGVQNVQATNLIKSGKTSTTTDKVTQTANIRRAEILQSGTTQSIQAGNGLITLDGGAGGGIKQTFTTSNTIDLFKQTSANGSVQALNYLGKSL